MLPDSRVWILRCLLLSACLALASSCSGEPATQSVDLADRGNPGARQEQETEYDELLGNIKISAPDQVRHGEPLVIIVAHTGRVSHDTVEVYLSSAHLVTESEVYSGGQSRSDLPFNSSWGELAFQIPFPKPPGCYDVTYLVNWRLSRREDSRWQTLYEKQMTTSASLKVLELESPEAIRLVPDRELARHIKQRVGVSGRGRHVVLARDSDKTVESDSTGIDIYVHRSLPKSLAFKVYARGLDPTADNGEVEVGYWYCPRGTRDVVSDIRIDLAKIRRKDADTLNGTAFDITCRPSLDVARKMVDPGDVWDGEVEYEVPLGFCGLGTFEMAPFAPLVCSRCSLRLHGLRALTCPVCRQVLSK